MRWSRPVHCNHITRRRTHRQPQGVGCFMGALLQCGVACPRRAAATLSPLMLGQSIVARIDAILREAQPPGKSPILSHALLGSPDTLNHVLLDSHAFRGKLARACSPQGAGAD